MSGQSTILSDIFERSLSLDSKKNSTDRAMSLWEGMAHSLDEIAANTRSGVARKAIGTSNERTSVKGAGARNGRSHATPQNETATPGRRGKTSSAHSILSAPQNDGASARPRRQSLPPAISQAVAASPAEDAGESSSRKRSSRPKSGAGRSRTAPIQESSPQAGAGLLAGQNAATRTTESNRDDGKTQSQESLERARNESASKVQAKTIADTLKDNLSHWDGSLVGAEDDATDAAGIAAGGPIYAAVKEVAGALETKDEDDTSLLGAFKKSIADKTGITAVKEKAASAKEGLKDRIRGWSGRQDAAQAEETKAKRDKKGRFIRPTPNTAEKEQTELATLSFDLAQRESKESKKRHQELVRAVRSIDGGGGLLDNALDLFGNRGGGGRDGRAGRNAGARSNGAGRADGRRGGRLSRLGGRVRALGSRALATGAGILGAGSLLGGANAIGLASSVGTAASTAGGTRTAPRLATATATRSAGLLGTAGAAGSKVLGGAVRAIPVLGQLAAVGMAAYEGVQGWNDSKMHQSAFGLDEGEEASTGQKASAAAANVLDMGGLLTGAAGLLGFEVDTADIASGIYTAGTAVTDTVVEAWDAVGGAISTASAAVGSTIAQAWDKASSAVSNAATATGEAVASAWDSSTSAVGGAVTSAWDSISSGASSAWAGVTGLFSDDKPEDKTSEAGQSATTAQAVAVTPATTLLGMAKPVPSQERSNSKEDQSEDELGMDAIIVPDEKMEGLFTPLTEAVLGLSQVIKDEIKRKELEEGGMFSTVNGLVSGVSSWVNNKLSTSGGGRGGSVSQSSTGGTSSRYAYDPKAKIGDSIAKFESGTSGVKAIGYDSTGGTSYGKFQLSSTTSKGGEGAMQGFLRDMQARGGEHAEIAKRIQAAGPLNTGGRGGAAVEQYKKEVGSNAQLMEDAQREYMLKANYAPAMARVSDGLRKKIEGSKALQEAMFSTAVQHGAGNGENTGAGASNIWNKVYREGMSEEDIIRAVYNERTTRFGSSTPQVQNAVRKRMGKEQDLILSMRRGETSTQGVATAIQNSPQDKAVQAAASTVIQASTQDAVNRGVKYDFGAKNSESGGIDCSGWVAEVNRNLMEGMNASLGQEVYGKDAKRVLVKGANGGAAGIIQAVSEATGQQFGNADLAPDKVREGMMIGMDTGGKGWDAGRYKGIDHIVQTYRDQITGQMMVSESTSGGKSGKGGVRSTPYEEWYAKWEKKAKLYGTDITQLADSSKIVPHGQAVTAVAESNAQTSPTPPADAQQVAVATSAVQPQTAVSVATAAPVAAAVPNPKPQSVESVGDIAPPENTGTNTMQTAGIEKLLQGILSVLTQQGRGGNTNGGDSPPHINMDYDDQTALSLAHDRA